VDERYLGIYLNDHLAGAVVGLQLARRTLQQNPEGALADFVRVFAREIEEDREALARLMESLEISTNPVKTAAGWLVEKLGRFKFNGHVVGYSPLSRLEELEVLSLAVEGKRLMWRLLKTLAESDDRLKGFDFPTLIERAVAQREELERHRLAAAAAGE
jgi:hypothetical protein